MGLQDNFIDEVEEVENVPVSAEPSAPKKVVGRPITKENCRQYQLSAAKAKRLRKEARDRLLHGLVAEDIDMVAELKKAIRENDDTKIAILERAMKLIGITYDQADENRIQNLNIKQETTVKKAAAIKVVFTDAKAPEEVKAEE